MQQSLLGHQASCPDIVLVNFSCIERWLKGQGGKCPQCNAKAHKRDIRMIYAKALRVSQDQLDAKKT